MRRVSASQRCRCYRVHGIDQVLRRLDRDWIIDSGFRIGPEVRCDLRSATERNQNAVRYIALGEAEFLRAGTIDFQLQLRGVCDLMQANIDCAWNLSHPRFDLARDPVVLRRVTRYLNVDRRRQTEIQNLTDDVGRWKIKTQIRKSVRECFAKRLH